MNSLQTPIASPFYAASTADDVMAGMNLTNKTAIVTGGYSGIGLVTTRALATAGAKVIVPARNVAKATEALTGIQNVIIESMDLIDPESISAFTQRMQKEHSAIELLINNAGYIGFSLEHDSRGYEAQFATNHLGHFQLTLQLWPLLVKQGARVVTVSSCGHAASPVCFDDLHFRNRDYDAMKAYGQSKSANALFALWLDRIGQAEGIRAYSLHPGGIIESGFARQIPEEGKIASGYLDSLGQPVIDPENNKKTLEQGAATQLWCATSSLLNDVGGVYCENCNIASVVAEDSSELIGVRPWAIDEHQAQRLWTLSEEMTGVSL